MTINTDVVCCVYCHVMSPDHITCDRSTVKKCSNHEPLYLFFMTVDTYYCRRECCFYTVLCLLNLTDVIVA